jgi:hypothetical protein
MRNVSWVYQHLTGAKQMYNRRETDRRAQQETAAKSTTDSVRVTLLPQETLRMRAQHLRHEADDLDMLANTLPGVMPEGAEQALQHLLLKANERF